MKKASFSIFLLATAFFCFGQKDGNGQTAALAVNDTPSTIEQFARQPAVDDTLYCIKLMNQAITARYGADGPNFLQDALHEKMGCTVCSEHNDKDTHDVMLWVLSKVEKGDLMRFWQFYWSSLSHEEDGGAVNHDHDKEVERILSLMDKYSPEMKRAAYIAYEYFSNGVMSDDWYPYPEDYIKAVKPYAERYKHKFWMPKFEDRVCVATKAQYPGGIEAMRDFIQSNLKFDKNLSDKPEEVVLLQAFISAEGEVLGVSDKTDKNQSDISQELRTEAMRVFNLMPQSGWTPATLNSKPVEGAVSIPIRFPFKEEEPENVFWEAPDEIPIFPGGMSELMKYIQSHIKYPSEARKKGIQGRVFVQFLVEKDGKISDPVIYRGVSPELDVEALRLVSTMPMWKPAENRGKKISMTFTLPIQFRL